jgi:hypothetical protein
MLSQKRGRPRKQGHKKIIRVKLTLWGGEDDDLIELLSQPKLRVFIIKAALRGSNIQALKAQTTASAEEVLSAFDALADDSE